MGQWTTRGGPLTARAVGAVAAAVALGGLAACYPGEPTSISQTQVVITAYDKDFDYSSQRTYAIPDTVVEVCDLENPDPGLPISCDDNRIDYNHAYDSQLVARVVENMNALGYSRIPTDDVTEGNLPDVALITMVSVNEWTSYTYWGCGGYWGWWGWYPPGYGCWYPGYISTTTWEQGTLFVDMLDPSGISEERVPSVWTGAINAVLSSSNNTNLNLALSGIDKAFDQSADYLMVQ
jgi:hypothetical protein